MLHPEEPRPADARPREADPWPVAGVVALAIIGPFVVGIAIAALVALTG